MEQDNSKKILPNQYSTNRNSTNQERIVDIFSSFIEDKIESIDGAEVFIKRHVSDAADMVINLIKTSNCR